MVFPAQIEEINGIKEVRAELDQVKHLSFKPVKHNEYKRKELYKLNRWIDETLYVQKQNGWPDLVVRNPPVVSVAKLVDSINCK